jgi:hypothetical protein
MSKRDLPLLEVDTQDATPLQIYYISKETSYTSKRDKTHPCKNVDMWRNLRSRIIFLILPHGEGALQKRVKRHAEARPDVQYKSKRDLLQKKKRAAHSTAQRASAATPDSALISLQSLFQVFGGSPLPP